LYTGTEAKMNITQLNPLEVAQQELELELRKRAEVDEKIKALQEAIALLKPIYERPISDNLSLLDRMNQDLGMTDRIRSILIENPKTEISPTKMRDLVGLTGFKLQGRSNPMAEIHTILKRLVDADNRFSSRRTQEGETLYKFDPSVQRVRFVETSKASGPDASLDTRCKR
jgi:hypothetical protein